MHQILSTSQKTLERDSSRVKVFGLSLSSSKLSIGRRAILQYKLAQPAETLKHTKFQLATYDQGSSEIQSVVLQTITPQT